MPKPDPIKRLQAIAKAEFGALQERLRNLQVSKDGADSPEIASLKAKLAELQRRYPELRQSKQEAMDDMAQGVKNAWGELRKAAEVAKKRFK